MERSRFLYQGRVFVITPGITGRTEATLRTRTEEEKEEKPIY